MSLLKKVTIHRIDAAKNDQTKFTWHGKVLTSLTDLGLTIFSFSKDYRSLSKEINFVEHFVEHPKHSVTSELIPRSFVPHLKDNFNYTQLIVDPVLWPHNPQLEAEATKIITYEYAPAKLTLNNEYIIATLSCSGNVEILTFEQNNYSTKYNLTKKYLELKNESRSHPKTSAQLKDIMDIYATSAICFQPNMIDEHSCYFVTVQFNSDLLFWLITSDNSTISLKLKFTHILKCNSILCAKWIPISKDNFHLICADITGQLFMHTFCIKNVNILPIGSTLLWEDQDKMVARNIIYSVKNSSIYLLFSKNRHLIVQLLDKNVVVKQHIKNINDFKIVSIIENGDSFYVGTANCKIYVLNILNPNLLVEVTQVELPKDIVSSKYELQNVDISKDKSFLALGLLDLKLCTRKNKVTLDIIIFNNTSTKDIISELLDNPDKKITKFWQSIEYLRQTTLKNKSMPDIDYNQLYTQADNDIYKLKLYYLFLTWYHYLLSNFVPVSTVLPEESLEKVREKILMFHAVAILKRDINKYPNCNEFEKEVLNGAKKYLLYYSNKYNESIDKYIEMKRIESIEQNIVYFCQSCDKEITGLTCKDNHFSLICLLTFTVIEDDYLTCRHCSVVARIELFSSKPKCVFCDLPLNKSF